MQHIHFLPPNSFILAKDALKYVWGRVELTALPKPPSWICGVGKAEGRERKWKERKKNEVNGPGEKESRRRRKGCEEGIG